jgi:phosphatidylinositol glycan class C protein
MSVGEWEKVLWRTQSYPDNHIPERYFLASLRKNRELQSNNLSPWDNSDFIFTANFRPYTYWPLVLASCAITQHLATIYIFLAIFVRLKEGYLDARILVWVSVGCFVGGYMTWELLDCSNSDSVQRNTSRQ